MEKLIFIHFGNSEYSNSNPQNLLEQLKLSFYPKKFDISVLSIQTLQELENKLFKTFDINNHFICNYSVFILYDYQSESSSFNLKTSELKNVEVVIEKIKKCLSFCGSKRETYLFDKIQVLSGLNDIKKIVPMEKRVNHLYA